MRSSESPQTPPMHERRHSLLGPIVATMLEVVAWLVFILLYALFWSKSYDLFQNIVVTIFSLAITGILIGVMWVAWGFRHHGRFGDWSEWGPPKREAACPAPTYASL